MKTAILIAAATVMGLVSSNALADKASALTHAEKLKFNACIGTTGSPD